LRLSLNDNHIVVMAVTRRQIRAVSGEFSVI
jgi:hypothetical protein